MQNKREAIQLYIHMRRHLSPLESHEIVVNKLGNFMSMNQLESAYKTKKHHAKKKKLLHFWNWVY